MKLHRVFSIYSYTKKMLTLLLLECGCKIYINVLVVSFVCGRCDLKLLF